MPLWDKKPRAATPENPIPDAATAPAPAATTSPTPRPNPEPSRQERAMPETVARAEEQGDLAATFPRQLLHVCYTRIF